jgi:glycosyltransferase involved in cell wall biosynthesis
VNFLGRFEAFKDPLALIRAFAAARLPESAELRVIGAGPLEAELRQAAAASARAVSFVGWLDQPFAHFDRGDLLVLPSNWESYSYVVREALHYRVPVIASDIHVHRTALAEGEYGRLYPVGDVEALARELEQASVDLASLRAMSARGGEALTARYGAAPFWAALSADPARAPPLTGTSSFETIASRREEKGRGVLPMAKSPLHDERARAHDEPTWNCDERGGVWQ